MTIENETKYIDSDKLKQMYQTNGFIDDIWSAQTPQFKIGALQRAGIDVEQAWDEWNNEFNAHELEMKEALGIENNIQNND